MHESSGLVLCTRLRRWRLKVCIFWESHLVQYGFWARATFFRFDAETSLGYGSGLWRFSPLTSCSVRVLLLLTVHFLIRRLGKIWFVTCAYGSRVQSRADIILVYFDFCMRLMGMWVVSYCVYRLRLEPTRIISGRMSVNRQERFSSYSLDLLHSLQMLENSVQYHRYLISDICSWGVICWRFIYHIMRGRGRTTYTDRQDKPSIIR